jgi:hypothetical protein
MSNDTKFRRANIVIDVYFFCQGVCIFAYNTMVYLVVLVLSYILDDK